MGSAPPALEDLVMLPWTRAREALAERPVHLRVLTPPYPALGVGTLRSLRVTERDGIFHVVVGYDGYERLR